MDFGNVVCVSLSSSQSGLFADVHVFERVNLAFQPEGNEFNLLSTKEAPDCWRVSGILGLIRQRGLLREGG